MTMNVTELGINLDSIEANPSTIFVVDSKLSFVYCNPAWDVFALKNGGHNILRTSVIGTSILAAIPKVLGDFFEDGFDRVRKEMETWEHDYECSSPRHFRMFRMRVLPIRDRHFLVEHVLRVETPHGCRDLPTDSLSHYLGANLTITMCCHCRRTLRVNPEIPNTWDFVRLFIDNPPALVSHGLCAVCRTHYYGNT